MKSDAIDNNGDNPLLPSFRPPQGECGIDMLEPDELDWIENHAIENLKGRVETATVLAQEAHNTLMLVLTGTVGALAYGIKLVDGDVTYSNIGAAAACIWLMLVSAYVVHKCLRVAPIPAVYSQPKMLFGRVEQKVPFEEWRSKVVLLIEGRIQKAVQRNREVGSALNMARMLALLTPVVSGLSMSVYWLVHR
jgi:hypothetical protein